MIAFGPESIYYKAHPKPEVIKGTPVEDTIAQKKLVVAQLIQIVGVNNHPEMADDFRNRLKDALSEPDALAIKEALKTLEQQIMGVLEVAAEHD